MYVLTCCLSLSFLEMASKNEFQTPYKFKTRFGTCNEGNGCNNTMSSVVHQRSDSSTKYMGNVSQSIENGFVE